MELGFSSFQIGHLTSMGTLLGTAFLPFWGNLSDYIGSSKRVFIVCISITAVSIYLSITVIFLAYILEYAGCSPSLLGLVVGWRALMEIISMTISSRVIHRFSFPWLLTISGFLFMLEHLSYIFAHGLPSLLVIITFSGLAGCSFAHKLQIFFA